MCIEDAVMSRLTRRAVTVVPAGTPLNLPANRDRLSLRVTISTGAPASVTVTARPDAGGNFVPVISINIAQTDTGLLTWGNGSDEINYLKNGDLATGALTISPVGTNATVVETIAMPSLAKIIARRVQEIQDAYPSKSTTQPGPAQGVY